MKKIMCIYSIKNTINEKSYIGSAINFNRRKSRHLGLLRKNIHHSSILQNSYNKYGEKSFIFNILEIVDDKNLLIEREQFWMDKLNPELNVCKVAGLNSHIGIKRSELTKNKMRMSQLGKTHTKETKKLLSNINSGKTLSQEIRLKISNGIKNSIKYKNSITDERSEKIKQSRLKNGGYIVSNIMKEKISQTLKNRNEASAISIKVKQYDLIGNFIKEYRSLQKADLQCGFYKGFLSGKFKKEDCKEIQINNYIFRKF